MFKGEQEIKFATDEEQNVTMIIGDNGTGKTTIAQAFTWCLYGETSFEDKVLLCKSTSATLPINGTDSVKVQLVFKHNGQVYIVTSEQQYRKIADESIRPASQRIFKIAYKKPGGSLEYVNELETDLRMKEILPVELSRYFFFDGERIETLSKEIRRGRSQEFASAVRNLLGLSAYTSALNHLKGRGNNVIKSYEGRYDATSNTMIAEYGQKIYGYQENVEKIENRLLEIEDEKQIAQDKCDELADRIARNSESELLARNREDLLRKSERATSLKDGQIKVLLASFRSYAHHYFTMPLCKNALSSLCEADKIDKGVPNVNYETIRFLLERKKCICGTNVLEENEAYENLTKLLDYVPPKSIGNMVSEFMERSNFNSSNAQHFFTNFRETLRTIKEYENDIAESQDGVDKINIQIEGLENVGTLQADLSRYEKQIKLLEEEKETLLMDKGRVVSMQKEVEAKRKDLANRDSINRNIEIYKGYAQYMYDVLNEQYKGEEEKMRNSLQDVVNSLFQRIYKDDFDLSLDEKYNIQINANTLATGYTRNVETSTAQGISIIFAFIAGVIKLARESQKKEDELLVSEPYPLVMDAPLSAFDKTRIETVSNVLPTVAEQIIMFIKDTDGEIAENYLGRRIGERYHLAKKNMFEVHIVKGV